MNAPAALGLLLLMLPAPVARAQEPCPRATLPAYAHNDYDNRRPLRDALALGYSGVEADVFLLDGVLRVGHDLEQARRGGTLEGMYLLPLRELARRCGPVVSTEEPFLLNVELKESSRVAFDSLLALLGRYREMQEYVENDSARFIPVAVTLVGWHPPVGQLSVDRMGPVRVQYKVTRPEAPSLSGRTAALTSMYSVDYGKEIGGVLRRGQRDRWMKTLSGLGAREVLLRVYDVPADTDVYRELLAAGVDILGVENLPAATPALRDLTRVRRCYQLETGPWTISPMAQSAEEREVPPMPYLVQLDSSDASGFFEGTVWRQLIARYDSTVHGRAEWMWHSNRARLWLSTNSVFGGVRIEFPVAGAEMRGSAEVWTEYTGAHLPEAPARARATACPPGR